MKILAVFCFVAALAQAIDVDWTKVDTMEVIPKGIEGILDEAARFRTPESRIVGGEEATPGQFPYQIGLLASTPKGTGFCGGSILNEEWILTAAHCVDTATSVEVIIGAHNVVDGDEHQIRVPASKIIVHSLWISLLVKNDIALLQLSEKLKFNDRVKPIRLPSRSQIRNTFSGETGIISGWGKDSDSATAISPVLRWISNPIITTARCALYYFGNVISSQICLGASEGRSSCQGDSGGPLVVVDDDGELTQVGVVSHGIAFGCESGWPGVYTRVTSFLDWIGKNTDNSVIIRD